MHVGEPWAVWVGGWREMEVMRDGPAPLAVSGGRDGQKKLIAVEETAGGSKGRVERTGTKRCHPFPPITSHHAFCCVSFLHDQFLPSVPAAACLQCLLLQGRGCGVPHCGWASELARCVLCRRQLGREVTGHFCFVCSVP